MDVTTHKENDAKAEESAPASKVEEKATEDEVV
jgi:hypothetical protein